MIVGLTGGIGSGKTTVGNIFQTLGVPVYNSDIEAKRVMISSPNLRKQIIALLGKKAYDDKRLNRSYIAKMVFNDKNLLTKLNAIVHPAVREHFINWTEQQNTPYVIQETALLIENQNMDLYDKIILVTAPVEVKIKRVIKRDQITRQAVLDRMANQLSDKEKIPFAHFIINNEQRQNTKGKVESIHRRLIENYRDAKEI